MNDGYMYMVTADVGKMGGAVGDKFTGWMETFQAYFSDFANHPLKQEISTMLIGCGMMIVAVVLWCWYMGAAYKKETY